MDAIFYKFVNNVLRKRKNDPDEICWRHLNTDHIQFRGQDASGLSKMMSGLVESGLIERVQYHKRRFHFTEAGVNLLDSIEQTHTSFQYWIFPKETTELIGYLTERGVKFPYRCEDCVEPFKPWLLDLQARYKLSITDLNNLLNKSFQLIRTRDVDAGVRIYSLSEQYLQEVADKDKKKKEEEELAAKVVQEKEEETKFPSHKQPENQVVLSVVN